MAYRMAADYNVQGGHFTAPGLHGCLPGMGGCGCGGLCGGYRGMGLFESGFDFTGWHWPEYLIAGLGVYILASTVFTTKRAVSRVAAIPRERRKARAAAYRRKAAELTKLR